MKNIFIILLLLSSSWMYCQKLSLQEINSKNVLEMFDSAAKSANTQSSSTAIQIGDYNDLKIIDRSAKSELIVRQIGDYNNTLLVNPENKKSDTEIDIRGHNNYIDITGSNSISDGMKIRVNADDRTIFIRNY